MEQKESNTEHIQFKGTPSLKRLLLELAAKKKQTLSRTVREIIERGVKKAA